MVFIKLLKHVNIFIYYLIQNNIKCYLDTDRYLPIPLNKTLFDIRNETGSSLPSEDIDIENGLCLFVRHLNLKGEVID